MVSHGHSHAHDKPSKVQKKEQTKPKQQSTKSKHVQKRAVAHPAEHSRMYVLSQGPIVLNEDKTPAAKVSVKKPQADAKPARKEAALKIPIAQRVKKELKKSEWTASLSNVLLVALTVAAIFALVGVIYLGKQLKNASSNGYQPLTTTLHS